MPLVLAAIVAAAAFAMQANPAQATPSAPSAAAADPVNCRTYGDYTDAYSSAQGGYYYPSDSWHHTPTASACQDIQIRLYGSVCDWFRVRWTETTWTGWVPVCPRATGYDIITRGVPNGTRYRIESLTGHRLFSVWD